MMKKAIGPAALLTAAAVLLAGSALGSARAALTYYNQNYYRAEVTVSSIGVTLEENGEAVGSRYFDPDSDSWKTEGSGELLSGLLEEGEELLPGKTYPERLSVRNSGQIPAYVRVRVRASWKDASGKTDTQLDPDLIGLHYTGEGWIEDADARTRESRTFYYTLPLEPGEAAEEDLTDSLTVDPAIAGKVKRTVESTDENGDTTYTVEYAYDGYQVCLEAEADAVQTNSAQAAIQSAWGVEADIDGSGRLSLR